MRYSIAIVLAAVLLSAPMISAQKETKTKTAKSKVKLKNQNDSLSYSIGVAIMTNLVDQGVGDVNLKIMMQGFNDVRNKSNIMTAEASNLYVNDYLMKQFAKKAEKDKEAQLQWLEENKKKEGVVTTNSGLQYKIITQGTGPIPTKTNTVRVHYSGSLIDGKVFDSSYERNEPIDFPVTGVIAGWTEALLLMPQGSKWELYIPYNLAYGEQGAGGAIPPYATLIFTVELLEVK